MKKTSFLKIGAAAITLLAMAAQAATLNMTGGTIKNCQATGDMSNGGGVYVHSGTVFNMTDGTITNCQATGNLSNGGGVYVAKNGTFNAKGGKIYNCAATRSGGGVYLSN